MTQPQIPEQPEQPKSTTAQKVPIGIIVTVAAVVLVLLAIAAAAYVLGRHDEPSNQMAPTPSTVQVDEEGTCFILVPLLNEAQQHLYAIAADPDGSTLTEQEVESTQTALEAIQSGAPQQMRQEMTPIIKIMRELKYVLKGSGNRTLHTDDSRAAAIRLLAVCSNYARD